MEVPFKTLIFQGTSLTLAMGSYTSIRFLTIIISACRYPYRKIEYQKQTDDQHQQILQYSFILNDSHLLSL